MRKPKKEFQTANGNSFTVRGEGSTECKKGDWLQDREVTCVRSSFNTYVDGVGNVWAAVKPRFSKKLDAYAHGVTGGFSPYKESCLVSQIQSIGGSYVELSWVEPETTLGDLEPFSGAHVSKFTLSLKEDDLDDLILEAQEAKAELVRVRERIQETMDNLPA